MKDVKHPKLGTDREMGEGKYKVKVYSASVLTMFSSSASRQAQQSDNSTGSFLFSSFYSLAFSLPFCPAGQV